MNFLADESVDAPIVERLRADGHRVEYVAEMSPSVPDDTVLDLANSTGSILLTGDKDFGEMVFRLHRTMPGVVLVRLAGLSALAKATLVAEAIRAHEEELAGAFAVISPGMVRIRRRV